MSLDSISNEETEEKQPTLLELLSFPPKEVKKHETLKLKGSEDNYEIMPIKVVEDELNRLFELYKTSVVSHTVFNNYITIVKRLSVVVKETIQIPVFDSDPNLFLRYDYEIQETIITHDGIASYPITPDCPLQLATSICNSLALKNAAENLGAAFGRDLNRGAKDFISVPEIRQKKKADIVVMKKYENALKTDDLKTIQELKDNYELNIPDA